ncbi:helix-turn-helix domain-containing protein [Streptacidiphilus fuscans]|uniref:Helix-turn-helix domain-containing protein n=1 Tax=Streptacidiphilus fuscans TaxID=2789292 RepID=A0A931AZH0_9ACTN|nr:helix-turn-helix transcriptional regulator [Streptacidiphilus fuscans]MBF9068294.1 helix-turn-helix domain-containing protein [Streptacidiphilus fuscans]
MHVNEFAAQLRELKDRSGRSYGMLAKRLHVSTSTLHRYCNGAAVPADYAPVERFARVCGATPEELVELHRRWLLADAERRREPARAAGREPAAVEDQEAAEPEAVEAVPSPVPGPALAPAPDEPVVAAASPELPLPGRPRRPRRLRGTRALWAALAVLAIAVPVGLVTAQHDSDTAASVTAPGGGAASHSGAAVPATPRASGSSSPTSLSSSSSSSPSDLPPSGSSSSLSLPASPSGPAGPMEDSTTAPFQVSVMSDNWDTQCDQWFLTSQAPSNVPTPPAIEGTARWASRLGAVPAAHLRLQLTAQGDSAQSVVLHALYVHVVSSRPAPKGNGYTAGSGCGGGLTPASFAVDLDSPDPHARAVPGYQGNIPTPVMDFPFQTSASDPQVLDVDAHTADQDVSWYLDLLWSSGDRQGVLRVDDHGQPFRTVGLAGDPTYFYNGSTWATTAPPS